MKTIYQAKDNTWYDERPLDDEAIKHEVEVDDEIKIGVLNSTQYDADGYDETAYQAALVQYQVRQATGYLQLTDYVPVQWQDETALGIEHSRTQEEYMDILQQRQAARELIRNQQPTA